MKYVILGNGRMGRLLFNQISINPENQVVMINTANEKLTFAHFENAQMVIDFSSPETIRKNFDVLKEIKIPLLIATTGQNHTDLNQIEELSRNKPVLKCPNTSFGINSTYQLIKQAARMFDGYDIEMIEVHHTHKADSPSGTALYLLQAIQEERKIELINGNYNQPKQKNQVAIHALRSGGVFGEHTIIFANQTEQIEITHRALSPELFTIGALNYAQILKDKENGLYNPINITKGE